MAHCGFAMFTVAIGRSCVLQVYSLVLETQGAFTIGQWDAVGLGHGFSDTGPRSALQRSVIERTGETRQ